MTMFIYFLLVVWVIYFTKKNNMWGVSGSTKKAKDDTKAYKAQLKKRTRTGKMLEYLEKVSDKVGFSLSEYKRANLHYQITRLHLKVKILDRNIKEKELDGLLKVIQLVGLLFFLMVIISSGNPIAFVFLILCAAPNVFSTAVDMKLLEEDKQLDRYFPDLYFVLYPRLIKGSHARLAPPLRDYSNSLGVETKDNKIIKQFVKDFLNKIDMYGQDSLAIVKLRNDYKSVMVINFCNLAVQAMNGVKNEDKLLTFKIELNKRRTEMLEAKANKVVAKGSRAIMLVYVILGQFVLLSFAAKLGPSISGLFTIFG